MKIYTIIGGVNGTGKSSLTGVLKAETADLGKIIDVDKLNFQYGNVIDGGKAAVNLINSCLNHGVSFTQETTLSGHKTAKTAKLAHESGYFVRLYYVGLSSVEESIRRIANRVQKGGHNIPTPSVKRRFHSRFKDIAAVLPYCDVAMFYDNENGFKEVAEYRNGELTAKGEPIPTWLAQLAEYLKDNADQF